MAAEKGVIGGELHHELLVREGGGEVRKS